MRTHGIFGLLIFAIVPKRILIRTSDNRNDTRHDHDMSDALSLGINHVDHNQLLLFYLFNVRCICLIFLLYWNSVRLLSRCEKSVMVGSATDDPKCTVLMVP